MAIEISPVFGLTLAGMIEIAVFVGAAVGIGSSLIIAYAIRKSNKALLKQQEKTSFDMLRQQDGASFDMLRQQEKASRDMLEQQKTINSAKLALHFLEYWKDAKHKGFQEFLKKLHQDKISKDDSASLIILTIFEDIAILWHEGTLTDNHVKEFFGNPLRDIRDSRIMQDRIKKESKSESDFILVNLRALLRETVKWKI